MISTEDTSPEICEGAVAIVIQFPDGVVTYAHQTVSQVRSEYHLLVESDLQEG